MRRSGDDVTMIFNTPAEVTMGIVRLARRAFANTFVERLAVTTWAFRLVWRLVARAPATAVSFRGACLVAPVCDVTITPGLLAGYYERIELDLFEELVRLSRRVVDVGGNIGVYACVGGLGLPAGASLTTFEPVPGALAYLHANVVRNGLGGRVVVEPLAVGDADGEMTIHLARRSFGQHSASRRNAGRAAGAIRVPAVSLDGYLARRGGPRVDLLKVDVEGYDGFVLEGARDLLVRDRPTLMVEFVPAQLRNCGFCPADFVARIVDTYPDVFLVDEPQAVLTQCAPEALLRLARGRGRYNLVATARAEHREVIERAGALGCGRPGRRAAAPGRCVGG